MSFRATFWNRVFNTSPVLLTPLTDDYEYVKDQLDLIAQCLKSRNEVNLDDAFHRGTTGYIIRHIYHLEL